MARHAESTFENVQCCRNPSFASPDPVHLCYTYVVLMCELPSCLWSPALKLPPENVRRIIIRQLPARVSWPRYLKDATSFLQRADMATDLDGGLPLREPEIRLNLGPTKARNRALRRHAPCSLRVLA